MFSFSLSLRAQSVVSGVNFSYENNRNKVVKIITYKSDGTPKSQGSGFIFNSQGQIITNYHVLIGACSAVVIVPGIKENKEYRVIRFKADRENDVAILSISNPSVQPVSINQNPGYTPGEQIFVISHPDNISSILSEGHLLKENKYTFDIETSVAPGSSGGPVFDLSGRVIGIISAGFLNSLNAEAIKIEIATNLFSSNQPWDSLQCGNCDDIYELYSTAVRATSQGKFNIALNYYSKVLACDSNYSDAYMGIGNIFKETGNYYLAVDYYTKSIAIKNRIRETLNLESIYLSRGASWYVLDKCNNAISDLNRVLQINPGSCPAKYILFKVFSICSKDFDNAVNYFSQARTNCIQAITSCDWAILGNSYYYKYKETKNRLFLDSAKSLWQRSLDSNCNMSLPLINIFAYDSSFSNKVYNRLRDNPATNADDWAKFAENCINYNMLDLALNALNQINVNTGNDTSNRSTRCKIYNLMASKLILKDKYSDAIRLLSEVAECVHDNENSKNLLYESFSSLGIEQYNMAVNDRNDNENFQKIHLDSARQFLLKAIEINNSECKLYRILGKTYYFLKRYNESLSTFGMAIRIGADTCRSESFYWRGMAYRAIKSYDNAINDFHYSFNENKNEQLSKTFYQKGEFILDSLNIIKRDNKDKRKELYKRADTTADSAIYYNKVSPNAFYFKGRVDLGLERYNDAVKHFLKARESGYTGSELNHNIGLAYNLIADSLYRQTKYREAVPFIFNSEQELLLADTSTSRKIIRIDNNKMLVAIYMRNGTDADLRHLDTLLNNITSDKELSDYAPFWSDRAWVKIKLGAFVEAKVSAEKAIELLTEGNERGLQFAEAYEMLFTACLNLQDFTVSCSSCQKMMELKRDDPANPCKSKIFSKFKKECR